MLTVVPLSEAKSHLSEIGRRVHDQHERVMVTRNGEAQFVMLSPDDLEALETTIEVLSDPAAVADVRESMVTLAAGDRGASLDEVRADLARRRRAGA